MKALYICHQYWPFLCGSGIFFQEMAERLVREGHEASVYTTDALHFERFISRKGKCAGKLRESRNGVSIRRFRLRHLPSYNTVSWRLRRLPLPIAPHIFSTGFLPGMALECFKRHSFDLVHGGLVPYGMPLYLAYRIAKKEGVPLIYSPFVHIGEPQDDQVLKIHTDPEQIRLLSEADGVICQTTIEAESLSRLGVHRERIEVIGMGVNPDDLPGGDGDRFRKKHGIEGSILFSVAPKVYDKGTQHSVRALERLLQQGYDVSLVLAGPTFDNFGAFYKKLSQPIRERLILIERIEGEEKKDLFSAGDIMVMPSRNESFGMVYLEAWSCGIPVVGALAGGVPEVIEDGKDGILVPFGDSETLAKRLENLLDNTELRDKMGRIGREKVLAKYTWDIQYNKLKELYVRLGCDINL
ncbi:MAG: glycosyltransferase family 4 protein [Candidatus Tritonobacter lacicola]|nr:glycosyltransferase family 4 protein [Candidatus Tritonobacter lacicola]